MQWPTLLTAARLGKPTQDIKHARTEFQRDYDRIIFSAPFRRMQNKTQVFPLPGTVFVHNRLTHSIEVSSVGRSLANSVATRLAEKYASEPYCHDFASLGAIISAACLAHDLGNPPFGHSGEKAISHYFLNGNGQKLVELTPQQRADVECFDGNANTFRLLSHTFRGRRQGGFALTMPTLASVVKYPYSSIAGKKKQKFGFFEQDEAIYRSIAQTLQIPLLDPENQKFARYPLVYLVEAADDICYQVMDAEDACRLGILSFDETRSLFMNFFDPIADSRIYETVHNVSQTVTDRHEQVAYMRTLVVGRLIDCATNIFVDNEEEILNGSFTGSLLDHLSGRVGDAMKHISRTAIERIYHHTTVAQVELSGFAIIGTLLDKFISALVSPHSYFSSLVLPFIPEQYSVDPQSPVYDKVMSAVDTVSGMTDLYALELYKKMTGGI